MWRRSVYLFLAHIFILHTCFIQFLAAADLRMRSGNNIVPRNVNLKKSANGTDVVDILNPQKIVLGSIFKRSSNLIWPYAKEVIDREALGLSSGVCEVVPAQLDENLGDIAAIATALYN